MRGLALGCLATAALCAGIADLASAVETLNGKLALQFGRHEIRMAMPHPPQSPRASTGIPAPLPAPARL